MKTDKKTKTKPKKTGAPRMPRPKHYLANGNKKHQCNGPAAWGPVLLAAARKEMGPTAKEGDGVRLALTIGVRVLAEQHKLRLAEAPHPDQKDLP